MASNTELLTRCAEKPLMALTLWNPMAWAIFYKPFPKDVENRDWYTKLRGTIAIHAAKTEPKKEFYAYKDFIREIFPAVEFPETYVRGAIIGTVDIVDCVDKSESPWFCGEWGFELRNPESLATPIPCRGYQMFWPVPADAKEEIERQRSLWRK